MARPEGSIVEGYIAKECMTLCSRYLKSISTKFNRLERNNDGGSYTTNAEISIFSKPGRALGAGIARNLSDDEWLQAHIYVLKNCDEVQPFLNDYSEIQNNNVPEMSSDEWNNSFVGWFKSKVTEMNMQCQHTKSESLQSLARGPIKYVTCFNGYVVNGFRFRIEDNDKGCRTQNSGVYVIGDLGTDTNPVEYYGVLTEILELQYLGARRVVLFRCRWFNVHDNEKGARVDGYGFTTINPQRILRTNEPFILANQASQVFYAIDNMVKGWHVVIKTQPRDLYKMSQSEEVENDIVENDSIEDLSEAYQYGESFNFKCTGDPVNFDNQNQVMNEKSSKNMNNKLPKILAPGGFSSHTLVMHFEELEFQEKDFNEDSSFLDILNLCKKFLDIYSVGIKVTDGDGRPLKNDRDVLAMVMNHEHVNCIHVYMEVDQNAQPLSFKMPEDNTLAPCVPSNPTVRNIKILGDFKVNKKVKICGTVIGGIEQASTVQLFIAISENFDMEENLKAISESKTEKEFYLPLEAVGHYVVAKYTPMSEDGKFGEPVFVTSNKMVEISSTRKEKKVRGENKNKKIAALKKGEKLDIVFYNNRPVGKNHQYWSRHLGKIVRDRNICPMQVLSWKDIQNTEKQHMWEAVKECFDNPNIELYRDDTLEHLCTLWTNWRSLLNVKFVRPYKSKVEALKNVPSGVNVEDWKWLVTNKFMTEKFQKISQQNTKNRSASDMGMPHRTGSRPHREIIYENGGKDSTPPDLGVIFLKTICKNEKLDGTREKEKYDEIVKTIMSNPSLSNLEIVEKHFGQQRHGHVYGYGGGVKRKHFNDSKSTYIKELEAKLHEKDEENRNLKRRMDVFESRLIRIENGDLPSLGTTTSDDIQERYIK
nr:uncharacterized protein LOC110657485 [Ipomoea batatas]